MFMSIIDTTKLSLNKDQLDSCVLYLALSHYINSLTELISNPLPDIDEEEMDMLKFMRDQSIRISSELSKLIESIPDNDKQ